MSRASKLKPGFQKLSNVRAFESSVSAVMQRVNRKHSFYLIAASKSYVSKEIKRTVK